MLLFSSGRFCPTYSRDCHRTVAAAFLEILAAISGEACWRHAFLFNQAPHADTSTLFVMRNIEMHIGVLATHETDQFRGINARHMIMRLKRNPCHFAEVIHALAVFASRESNEISFRWGKSLQTLDGDLRLGANRAIITKFQLFKPLGVPTLLS